MKGDFSRDTFDPAKHYTSVRMQQGRVQLDADWNEQADIISRRADTATNDVIGDWGAPVRDAGFHLVLDRSQLTGEEESVSGNALPWPSLRARDFHISAGRLYVDGILVENEQVLGYRDQAPPTGDLPDPPTLPTGVSLAYLDVWQRHLTALEDPQIREVALGGPDTATRLKTVWQVRWFRDAGAGDCHAYFQRFVDSLAQRDGRLAAQAMPPAQTQEPCVIPPSAGYRGLENQLYRVELHKGGGATNLSGRRATINVLALPRPDQLRVASAAIKTGELIEVFKSAVDAVEKPVSGILARVAHVKVPPERGSGRVLTLDRELEGLSLADSPKVRRRGGDDAWFKWSRDNGSVVTKIKKIEGAEITVESLGPDDVLGFRVGDWVEITDDALELNAAQPDAGPAQIAQIKKVDETTRVITVRATVTHLGRTNGIDPARNPKLRRWDGIGAAKYNPPSGEDFQELEDGVQVRFSEGNYVPGDYWLIPARSATAEAESGNVLWPQSDTGPALLPPEGIDHHYCPLGVITVVGNKIKSINDCRELFPPLTAMTNLLYVGGDGQTGTPDPTQPDSRDVALGAPLQVRVVNGSLPVPNAMVRFRILGDPNNPSAPDYGANGQLAPTGGAFTGEMSVDLTTDDQGVASCEWRLDGVTLHQICEARLLSGALEESRHQVVRFNARLNRASEVSFEPPANCPPLAGRTNVQTAIEVLCQQEHGKGCCISIGEGGMVHDLREAAEFARSRDWRSACFCLLPGEHSWPEGLKLNRELLENLTISGLRSGSTLKAEGAIVVGGLASLTLRDVEIVGEALDGLVDVAETGWLVVDKCRLQNKEAPGGSTTLSISACDQLTIVDSEIECHVHGSDPEFDILPRLPQEIGRIVSAARVMGPQLAVGALRSLGSRPRAERQRIAETLSRFTQENQRVLLGGDQTTLSRLAEAIRAAQPPENLMADIAAIGTRRPQAMSATAIQLSDGGSRAWLERNTIRGPVTLYGEPTDERIKQEVAGTIRDQVLEKQLAVLASMGGELHLTGNLLQQVVFGKEWIERAASRFDEASFERLFRGITVSGNVFASYENELMAQTVILESNTFQQANEKEEYGGIVVAGLATFTGNVAEMPLKLVAAATEYKEAANLRMTFTP